MRIRLTASVALLFADEKPLPMTATSGSAKSARTTARMTKASPARLKTAPTRRHRLALVARVLDEDGHEGGGADRADQQVVQDRRDGAGDDEGVGAAGGAERRGDDDVAHQAQAAAQDVAERDDRRRAGDAPVGAGVCYPGRQMALLARFACGCKLRVEIPAPTKCAAPSTDAAR